MKVADRKCSCCGIFYADEEGHDYEWCVRELEERIRLGSNRLDYDRIHLRLAKSRREAQRAGRINKELKSNG